jgi:oxygen-dependent protoporphyrinogen oxidase
LSLLSTFPRLRQTEREHGGVVRGALAQRREAAKRPAVQRKYTPFVSLAGGLSQLIDALADAIGHERIRLATPVVTIAHDGGRYQISTGDGASTTVQGVVIATPASATSQIVCNLDPQLARILESIPYASSATISMAFDAAAVNAAQAGRGFVIPRSEHRSLTAVTWTSNKFAGRAPDDTALLRGFVGRAGDEAAAFMAENDLIQRVRDELRGILGITAAPEFARVYRWPHAMPQYTLGHVGRLARIDKRLAVHPGVALTGAAYRGVGIPDCISDATVQTNALLDRLSIA